MFTSLVLCYSFWRLLRHDKLLDKVKESFRTEDPASLLERGVLLDLLAVSMHAQKHSLSQLVVLNWVLRHELHLVMFNCQFSVLICNSLLYKNKCSRSRLKHLVQWWNDNIGPVIKDPKDVCHMYQYSGLFPLQVWNTKSNWKVMLCP